MRNAFSKFPILLFAVLAFLASFAGVALAADAVTPAGSDSSLLDLLKPVYELFLSGHYAAGSAAVLVLGVALARRYVAPHWSFLGTDLGGALLTLLGAFGAALGASMAGSTALTLALLYKAGGVAVLAAGGYSLLNKLLTALEGWSKLPSWAASGLRLITWIFDEVEGTSGAQAIATATAAGQAAVAAKPAQGAASAIGEATELK
jgi:hypothetical protein